MHIPFALTCKVWSLCYCLQTGNT